MGETATRLEPGFSVADATYPAFSLRDGEVLLEFEDWRERSLRSLGCSPLNDRPLCGLKGLR
jgi:hypothetical protein